MRTRKASPVLHGLVVQGQQPLVHLRVGGSVARRFAVSPAMAAPMATAPAASPVEDDVLRRAREDGFAKGLVDGRAKAAEEAAQLATQVAEKAERDAALRSEQLVQTLERDAKLAFDARVARLNALLGALPPQIEARLLAAEDDLLALCFQVVCRVLGENAVRPDAVHTHLRHAMGTLRDGRLVAVHLHPDDLAALAAEGVVDQASAARDGVRWIASNEVALSGCILESPEGGLDARFETQLQALRELLHESRRAACASLAIPPASQLQAES